MQPVVSIVGRPNVGKSTLFNRIIGYRKAITEDTPGVTRDRNYGEYDYNGQTFVLVDTGGFEPSREDGFFPLVKKQIHTSIGESSLIIFVLDGKDGILPQDIDIAKILRRYGKPVLYVINKVDSKKREMATPEFYHLGVKKYHTISALHGIGIGDLLEDIYKTLTTGNQKAEDRGQTLQDKKDKETSKEIRIAIVGRPNTGKSSITNRLLGSERMIVSEIPGTTRDAIDSKIVCKDKEIVLIDTAGLRKKSKILRKVEEYSVSSAIKSIERADVVNLIIDGEEGAGHQDAGIAHLIIARGKGMCIVVNKWDLVKGRLGEDEYKRMVQERIPHGDFCPLIFSSAKTGKNIEKIVEIDIKVYGQLIRRISTPALNTAFEEFLRRHSPPRTQGKQVKVLYVHQATTPPPTFILFSNYPESIPEHYKRYIENCIREKFGFHGAPIRLVLKKK